MTPPVAAPQPPDAASLVARLEGLGVLGVSIGWVDNNGIVRSRVVPLEQLPSALTRGVGITAAFGVFDSHDGITFAHEGLATPSGDVRLVPVVEDLDSIVALAGQPGLAWVPGRQLTADGDPWPYDQRAVLERQVAAAAEAGFEVRAGFEVEMVLTHDTDDGGWHPARRGPAYSANAVLDVHDLVETLLRDLRDNGVRVGQLHAEYGEAQLELSLDVADALTMADAQVLTRQTVHAAARAHGLRASFAPLASTTGAGNGWHLHTSLVDAATGRNALTGDPAAGGDEHGLSPVGRGYLAGLLRELPGVTAVTAPSTGSLLRRRPGYWAGAYGFWGVENREAALRLVPASRLLGSEVTNVELKACDASANPYLALAVTIAAGLAGVRDGLEPPAPVQEDVGTWDGARREAAGIRPLATSFEQQQADLLGSDLVREVLGAELLGAFAACRAAGAAWAADRGVEDVVASLRWQY
ncbi:glutamine synthetase family protein [Nocardioides aquaticus]|uniref:glutamine synthetase family protein n=1 Tax=Nocardioides aquaticus TaxID=160826 RepID=UPI0031DA40AC